MFQLFHPRLRNYFRDDARLSNFTKDFEDQPSLLVDRLLLNFCSFRISPGHFFLSRDTKRVTNPSADPRAKLNIECVLFVLMRGDFEESPAEKEGELSFLSFFFARTRESCCTILHGEREREWSIYNRRHDSVRSSFRTQATRFN